MKAVVQALYLLTNAIGNLIDLFAVAALASVWKSQVICALINNNLTSIIANLIRLMSSSSLLVS